MLDAQDLFERYASLLRSGGTNQLQRTLPALADGYVRPDERDLSGLATYASEIAREILFHRVEGQTAGHWRPLFEPILDEEGNVPNLAALENLLDSRDDLPPQLALIFAFFEAYGHVRAEFDRLPGKHLSHFYEEVVGLSRRNATPDQLHVVFEAGARAERVLLAEGTLFDAGVDALGQPRKYALERETIVTPARLSRIARSVSERDPQGRLRLFRAEPPPEGAGFATFGIDPYGAEIAGEVMQEVAHGFALADPVLRLAEGTRSIDAVLTLTLDNAATLPSDQQLTAFLEVELTGEEGWMTPDSYTVALATSGSEPVLTVHCTFGEGTPALVDFDPALHDAEKAPAPEASAPVMRLLFRTGAGVAEFVSALSVAECSIDVSVEGLADLVVQNDQRVLDPAQPMPVFSQRPRIGTNLYIGSSEAFAKELTSISLDFTWDGLPEDLVTHYDGYFDFADGVLTTIFRPSFTFVADMLDGRSWAHRLTGSTATIPLFDPLLAERHIAFAGAAIEDAFDGTPPAADPGMKPVERYELGVKRGFMRLTLVGPVADDIATFGVRYANTIPFEAFGHDAYPRRYANAAIALAQHDPATGDPPILPNEPYTPMMTDLRMGYSARASFRPDDAQATGEIYTIGAFGYSTGSADTPARLVPEMGDRAALHLGLENFDAPGALPVLFQIEEGTAAVADPPDPADMTWSYLRGDSWVALPPSAVAIEETQGFQRSGIVSVNLGHDATTEHTLMPAGLSWMRVVLDRPAGAAAKTIAIHAPAARVVFSPQGEKELADYDTHLADGLTEGQVTRLDKRVTGVKAVSQPYPSFAGRAGEDDASFFERNAERLRHRARVVTAWDFERLVLENFDGIFKARALANLDPDANEAPGQVALVLIPNLRNSQSENPLEPRAGETQMQDIRSFLESDVASPFAAVNVIHPIFERVRVDARIAFRDGFDPGFYSERLNEELQTFLSPWAFEEGRDIVFGGRIYRSELLKFVEDREYVDYVTRFDIYHAFDGAARGGVGLMEIGIDFVVGTDPAPAIEAMTIGTDFIVGAPVEAAHSTDPRAVIVSHPHHFIEPVFPGGEICTGTSQIGIGQMIVGLDFEVETV